MKKLPKILMIIFLIIFILQLASLIFLLVIPKKSKAADIKFQPQIEIPGSQFKKCDPKTMTPEEYKKCGYDITGKSIGEYIQAIYNYAIGIVGILAAVVLMWGGVIWLTAGGNTERVSSAKAWIGAALSGLVLVLTSYMILYTINPDLVSFKDIVPRGIEPTAPKNISCENNNIESSCTYAVGCKWENEKCILDTGYAKCGLTEEEKVGIARCCQKDTEYKYALIPFNQYCINVCGTGWVNVDKNKCETNLGY